MELLELIKKTMEDKKAHDVVVVDFKNTSPICDYFVICDASNARQVNAISEAIDEAVSKQGYAIRRSDSKTDSPWILLDAGDVVAHVFLTEERQRYNLEKLYAEYISQ
ncbi:ribosome-associated protein IOJAP [Erysipelothrix larvae]|uniref:Ribosomal silencing factor RsfS n=1 Tax=Erysipelothrix larvae TaxID=1514105 RepID=A0A0X8GZI3_9FIRM|nr:ribosome silencing factor [Erysipelothrix larvae]AMC93292.1 ribosome-associated protein IOJAP [Erysipelothrix larvae]